MFGDCVVDGWPEIVVAAREVGIQVNGHAAIRYLLQHSFVVLDPMLVRVAMRAMPDA